ncbi:MAG: glycosyltransferase family 9 protein, partial [Verrucomicrobiota bacterium]|nr:glycosyltransferase family 9 protein [Verrucomicrobiota bacterium]
NSAPLRRLLLIKLAEQGSTVLAYPAINQAVKMVGRENVYFILFEENRFILETFGLLPEENIISLPTKNFLQMARSGWRALRHLQKLKLDAAIDMEFFARGSAAIAFLSGAKWRVGFHSFYGAGPYRGDLMTHRLFYNPYLHTTQIFHLLIAALKEDRHQLPTFGIQPPPVENSLPQFSFQAEELEIVKTMLRTETATKTLPPLILLNPNAGDLIPLRRWADERYLELARRLIERYPEIYIGLTGASNEIAAVKNLAEQVGSNRCISLAGKTTLRQLLILYHLAEVLVTNDSGPAHFAALTPIHVVTLFGPETPALFGARTPRHLSLWAGIACSPCVNAYNNRQSPCQNNICMQQISVEQVFGEVCRLGEGRPGKFQAPSGNW